MKKTLFTAVALAYMLTLGVGTVCAQQSRIDDASQNAPAGLWSVGGGFFFDDGRIGSARGKSNSPEQLGEWVSTLDHAGFGVWGFVDAMFAELSVGFIAGIPSWEQGTPVPDTGGRIYRGSFQAMDLSLLGRFPFVLGASGISIFPLLGIGYNIVFSASQDDGTFWEWETEEQERRNSFVPSHLSTFRIMGGIGGDFTFSQRMFLRTSVLGSYRFAARHFRDLADNWRDRGYIDDVETSGGFGVIVRLGIGFRL